MVLLAIFLRLCIILFLASLFGGLCLFGSCSRQQSFLLFSCASNCFFCLSNSHFLRANLLTRVLKQSTKTLGHVGVVCSLDDLVPSFVNPLGLVLLFGFGCWLLTFLGLRNWISRQFGIFTVKSSSVENAFVFDSTLVFVIFIVFCGLFFIIKTLLLLHLVDVGVIKRLVGVFVLQSEPSLFEEGWICGNSFKVI